MLIREIEANCKTGEVIDRWIDSPGTLTEEEGAAVALLEQGEEARRERFRRLVACDWTTLPDVPLSDAQRAEWATFRQALRDVTEQAGFPDLIQWPTPPAELTVLAVPDSVGAISG